jgi:AmiR/NasT family two-component response regulator
MGSRPHSPGLALPSSVAVMAQRTFSAPSILTDPRIEPVSRGNHSRGPRGRSGQGFWGITAGDAGHLLVLIANEPHDRLESPAQIVSELGHTVITWDIDVDEVGAMAKREKPDVALVGLGPETAHALGLIEEIAHKAPCPVIALLAEPMPFYVREAARCGAFAYTVGATPQELQSAIDISMHRFADYHSLQSAFRRRAIIEQAKGILMARHALDSGRAFELLRNHSQNSGRKLVDVAALIVDSHLLLPPSVTRTPVGSQPLDASAKLPEGSRFATRT